MFSRLPHSVPVDRRAGGQADRGRLDRAQRPYSRDRRTLPRPQGHPLCQGPQQALLERGGAFLRVVQRNGGKGICPALLARPEPGEEIGPEGHSEGRTGGDADGQRRAGCSERTAPAPGGRPRRRAPRRDTTIVLGRLCTTEAACTTEAGSAPRIRGGRLTAPLIRSSSCFPTY